MGFIFEERLSASPYVESITHGWTAGSGSTIRPAESHWHLVLVRYQDKEQLIVTGPLTTSGVVPFTEGAEILWVKFKLGAFMPHLPLQDILNTETALPEAAGNSFWLHSGTWQFPDANNIDTFIERLVRAGELARDRVVENVMQDQPPEMSARTLRRRFLRATGLTHGQIRQIERAQRAAALIQQGVSILDTVYDAGYYDQPHLTRSLKQWVGFTPAQLVPLRAQRAGG